MEAAEWHLWMGPILSLGLLILCARASQAHGIEWLVDYGADRDPDQTRWTRRGGNARGARIVEGALRLTDDSSEDLLCYRADWDCNPGCEIVVEARVRVHSMTGQGSTGRLYKPWEAGVPIGILVSDGRLQEGIVLCPGYVGTWQGRFHLMDTTDAFHTYRLVIRGSDMVVYVDGELAIGGEDAFWRPAEEPTPFIQFGSNSNEYLGEADWEFVRLGSRPPAAAPRNKRLRVTLSEPWQIPDFDAPATRPYLYNLGDGLLMMSVAQGPDAYHEPYGVLKSLDSGRTWAPVQGLQQKVFAPLPMIRLSDGTIFGASRWTVECLSARLKSVAVAGISYEFDAKAESFRMYESVILGGEFFPDWSERQPYRFIFDRDIFHRPDGSLMAVGRGPDGSFVVESEDIGRTWRVICRMGMRGEAGVAWLSETDAVGILRQGGALPFQQVVSRDGGRTWGAPRILQAGSVDADLILMSNGVLACAYGRPGCNLMFSTDGGETWDTYRAVSDRMGYNYVAIREVSPGRLLYVHDAPPLTALYVDVERVA